MKSSDAGDPSCHMTSPIVSSRAFVAGSKIRLTGRGCGSVRIRGLVEDFGMRKIILRPEPGSGYRAGESRRRRLLENRTRRHPARGLTPLLPRAGPWDRALRLTSARHWPRPHAHAIARSARDCDPAF